MLLAAAILTIPVTQYDASWAGLHFGVFTIDLALLGGLMALALSSRSYWPIWMTAFHALSVCTHIVSSIDPHIVPKAYNALEAFWSIPVQLVMPLGVMLDWRAKLTGRWPGAAHGIS